MVFIDRREGKTVILERGSRVTTPKGSKISWAKAQLRPANHHKVLSFELRMLMERRIAHRLLEETVVNQYQKKWGKVPYDFATFTFAHTTLEVICELAVIE